MWKVGWKRIDLGRRRRYDTGLIFLRILKGPMNRGPSFRDSRWSGRSLVDNHTLWPWRSDGPILRRRLACFCCRCDALIKAVRAFRQAWRHLWTSWFAAGTWTSSSCSGNKDGGNPNWHSKGDMPKDEWCRVLRANSAQIRRELHVLWLLETRHLRVFSISWLTRSVWPLDWGWNPEDRLMDAPIRRPKAFQNREVNCDPRSETMSWGNPWILKTCCIMRSAVWQAVGILGRGIRWHAFENLSTTTKMTVLPCDLGSPVTKSKEMWDHGRLGIGKGWRRPWGWALGSLFWAHTKQPDTNLLTSACILGHQNRVWIRFKVLVTPGWPERDACPHCNTSDRTTLGTKRRPGGPLPGSGCWRWAFFTANSIPHWTPATTLELGMMASGLSSTSGVSNCLERASGLEFLEPGR